MDIRQGIRKIKPKNGTVFSDEDLYKNIERDEKGNIVRRKVIGSTELMHQII